MDKDAIHEVYKHVCGLVISAGEYVRSAKESMKRPNTASKECYADLVTEYDQNTEKMLISNLTEKYPKHKFIGEEMTAEGVSCTLTDEPTWIIDPIDGTTNFVHGYPMYCVVIAFFVNKEPLIGIVYDVPNDKFYSAIKGEGAFCNGRILKCSSTKVLQEALIGVAFGSQREPTALKIKIDTMADLIGKCHGLRVIGSAALNICAVAAGQQDAFYEFGPHIWDFAAAHLIALEAGALCSHPDGGPVDLMSRKILVACTESLRDQLIPLLNDIELERD